MAERAVAAFSALDTGGAAPRSAAEVRAELKRVEAQMKVHVFGRSEPFLQVERRAFSSAAGHFRNTSLCHVSMVVVRSAAADCKSLARF